MDQLDKDKTDKAAKSLMKSLTEKMSANKDAMDQLDKDIDRLKSEIAGHREDLVVAEGQMKDDEQYLKDLTARCEARANDYDQRSAMRGDELGALNAALKVLTGQVKGRADDVNQRALLIQKAAEPIVKNAAPVATNVNSKATKTILKSVSFLQASSTNGQALMPVLNVLRKEGQRLNSLTLLSLAQRVDELKPRFDSEAAYDPFKKVKGLIEKLIQRLVQEATNEATKKGFCDTELGKARKDRDFRREETQDLSSELEGLEAKEDALTAEIKLLTGQIEDETK